MHTPSWLIFILGLPILRTVSYSHLLFSFLFLNYNDQLSVGDGTITGAISSLNTSLDQVRHPYDSSGTIYVTGIISQKRVDTATGQVHYMIFIPFTFLYTLKSVIAIVVQNVVILRFDGTDANGFQLVNFFRNNQGLIFNFTTTSDAIDISGYFCDGALEFY